MLASNLNLYGVQHSLPVLNNLFRMGQLNAIKKKVEQYNILVMRFEAYLFVFIVWWFIHGPGMENQPHENNSIQVFTER